MAEKPQIYKTLALHFGALVKPLQQQLKEQGFKVDPNFVKNQQKNADAIVRLRIAGLLNEAAVKSARKKILAMFEHEIERSLGTAKKKACRKF
jgi:hypothetical protein